MLLGGPFSHLAVRCATVTWLFSPCFPQNCLCPGFQLPQDPVVAAWVVAMSHMYDPKQEAQPWWFCPFTSQVGHLLASYWFHRCDRVGFLLYPNYFDDDEVFPFVFWKGPHLGIQRQDLSISWCVSWLIVCSDVSYFCPAVFWTDQLFGPPVQTEASPSVCSPGRKMGF